MKSKPQIESIYNLPKYLKDDSLLPIYFLFGEDSFTINNAVKTIEKKIAPLVVSDFDTESLTLSKENSISQFVDFAYSFPFGDGKKMITVKNFDTIGDKKAFANYVKDPAEFSFLIITQYSQKVNLSQEPYKSLYAKNYIFEAKELKGRELSEWLHKKAKIEKLELTSEAGQVLIEMVGENKAILEMQLKKLSSYSYENEEITPEVIRKLAEITKEYSIFDLQSSLGKGDKGASIKIAYNLLGSRTDMVFIISMLTKFISTLTQILEIKNQNISDFDAGKEIGVSPYYYKNVRKATYLLNEIRLANTVKALLEADIRLKTSNIDDKTNLTVLITEILK